MQKVEYNHIKNIFPFIFNSKFILKNYNQQPFIKNFEVSLQLNYRFKPEILFWILFSINNKKNFLQFVHKKKYINGKSIFTKSFLNISKKFGSKNNIIYFINKIYNIVLIYSKEINLVKSYPLKTEKNLKVFKFYDIKFEDKYNGLINLAPRSWINYNLKFIIKPNFFNGYHFRFFLQNLQLPII